MTTRRSFLTGLLATGLAPKSTWADLGGPAYLSAGMKPDGCYVLCGLHADGSIVFEHLLPARGHAAAAHPVLPEAVAFARRPGMYAVVLDCVSGQETARLKAPSGRHFYGHGTFSGDGNLLFTTENDFADARGMIGVWDAQDNYVRIAEFPSGGVGPHDICLMPDGRTLVIANGGIATHPETGRAKLHLSSMRSNLSYVSLSGAFLDKVELDDHYQKSSIRHLSVAADGNVAFAMQWQGDLAEDSPLLGVQQFGSNRPTLFEAASVRNMRGYLGSVAFEDSAGRIATTSPRSGILQIFDQKSLLSETRLADVCGVASSAGGFIVTSGNGVIQMPGMDDVRHDISWDNHLVAI